MKIILPILSFLFLSLSNTAQVEGPQNQDAAPKGGLNKLAIKYYGIDFSKEQRELLKDKEIEFVFAIDELGNPSLEEVNGVADEAILDSLKAKSETLEQFQPQIRDGEAVPAIFFMLLEFPTYRMTERDLGLMQGMAYNEARLEGFEYIRKSGARVDVVWGGMMNQFVGRPSEYLATGGGMKVDIAVTARNDFFYGLSMNFYGNRLKQEYPLVLAREQLQAPPTLLIGGVFGKWFNRVNVQFEIQYALQNVTEKIGDVDPDWVQLEGLSPGFVVNFPILLGKEKPMDYYGSPALLGHYINLHGGIRYLGLSLPEASGVMWELGVGYRMGVLGVEEYKFRDGY